MANSNRLTDAQIKFLQQVSDDQTRTIVAAAFQHRNAVGPKSHLNRHETRQHLVDQCDKVAG